MQSGGTHFSPEIVDAFLAMEGEFVKIGERYRDALVAAA